MLDTDGLGGLQVQLATYRMLDDWEEARRIREDGWNSYNLTAMILNYDRLVVRFNALLDASRQTASYADQLQSQVVARDQAIADLKRQLADAQAETLDVRQKWARSDTQIVNRMYAAEDELRALRSRQT